MRVSRIALDDPSNPGNPHFSNALSYEHAGLERVVGKSYDMAGSGATTWRLYDSRSAGQAYNGLDRWGRTKEIWVRGSGTLRSHLSYSYNELGSVTARMEELSNLYDETYAYDGLERLSSQTVTRPSTGWSQTKTWELSLLGNWRRAAIQGGVSDTRTHNRENEVATRTYGSNDVAPEYDVRGNTTVVPRDSSSASTPCAKVVYDAWDRPVEVHDRDNAQNVYAHYRYDGLGRVIWRKLRDASGNFFERHYYYSDGWQVLSERASAQAGSSYRKMDYVWGVAYVDEIVSRLEYSGGSAVRKDFVQDANWNVVMLLSASGTVDGRYRYDPYGDPVFLSASGNVKTSGILNATYLLQGRRLLEWRAPGGTLLARTYHYRHREHLPVLGRFAQRDPLAEDAALNANECLAGNPAILVDPTGLQSQKSHALDPKKNVLEVPDVPANELPKEPSDCNVYVIWGHGGDVKDHALKLARSPEKCCWAQGLLGCRVGQPGICPIKTFPDCSEANIGISSDSYSKTGRGACSEAGNATKNPRIGKGENWRNAPRAGREAEEYTAQGFNRLLADAWDAARRAGNDICAECCECKEVKIGFYCVSPDRTTVDLLRRAALYPNLLDRKMRTKDDGTVEPVKVGGKNVWVPKIHCGAMQKLNCEEIRATLGRPCPGDTASVMPGAGGGG